MTRTGAVRSLPPGAPLRARRLPRHFPSLARTGRDGRPLAYFDGPAGSQVPRPVIDTVGAYYETANANSRGRFATSQDAARGKT